MVQADPTTQARPTAPSKCAACDRPLDNPIVCAGCHTLFADGARQDYFSIFGLPRRYVLDRDDLRRRYIGLSREVHPDQFAGDGESVIARSMEIAARLNRAYEVLSDPVLRAEYLLELAGGPSAAGDRSVPQHVLSAALMLREEMEEARNAGDTSRLEALRPEIEAAHRESLDRIAALADELPGDEALRRRLRQALNVVTYHRNLLEELRR